MELRVNDLSVSLGGAPILRHVSLAVEDGAFFVQGVLDQFVGHSET